VIDGPHIVIGSDALEKDNGAGEHVFIGRDAEESMVLGDTLKQLLDTYSSDVNTHIATFADALNSGLSAPPGVLGNFGIPLPGMPIIVAAASALKASVNTSTTTFKTDL
jgi:hypothetical protein